MIAAAKFIVNFGIGRDRVYNVLRMMGLWFHRAWSE